MNGSEGYLFGVVLAVLLVLVFAIAVAPVAQLKQWLVYLIIGIIVALVIWFFLISSQRHTIRTADGRQVTYY